MCPRRAKSYRACVPSHRARGLGRFLALRPARPRHRRAGPPPPTRRILTTCVALSTLGVVLIGARLAQTEIRRPERTALPLFPPAAADAPPAYTPDRAAARARPQRRKQRPPVALGALTEATLTPYCVEQAGPLTVAVRTGDRWVCRPFLGTPRPIDLTAACRFAFGPAAYAVSGSCYRPAGDTG